MTSRTTWVHILLLATVHVIPVALARRSLPVSWENDRQYCRDRLGYFKKDDFKISTCTMCYFYLILQNPAYRINKAPEFRSIQTEPYYLIAVTHNEDGKPDVESIYPTLNNTTVIDRVCQTLEEDECTRWITCCDSAWKCCQHQIENSGDADDDDDDEEKEEEEKGICPHTFDGWSCWDSVPANTTVSTQCPSFLSTGSHGTYSQKTCLGDGTWEVSVETGLEHTDYEKCIGETDMKIQKEAIILSVVLNILGSLLLLPAIVIFANSRILRKQQRIKIHTNLFLSILLTSVFSLVWDICVTLDRIDHTGAESFLHRRQALCKTIYLLHQFVRASTFFWMSCEGYFLHRLMVNAFLPPKHFYGYMVYGWGLPLVLFSTYGGVRKAVADDSVCWILPLDGSSRALEWVLVFAPIMGCLLANMVFFGSILKLMLTKLVVHPEEPSKFRRAIKATSLLIPLFGLHLFCFMYRPKVTDGTGYDVYEIFSAIILNSQGILVSLLLFYCNGEVQAHVISTLSHWRKHHLSCRHGNNRKLSVSMTGSASRRTSVSSSQTVGLSEVLTADDNGVSTNLQTTKF